MKLGLIYVIGTTWDRPIKIGVATDIARRLSRLQSGNPDTLCVLWESAECDDVYAVESHLHRAFSDSQVRGEWFLIPKLEPIIEAFDAFNGRRYGAKTQQTDASIACCKAVAALVDRVALRDRMSTEAAIKNVAKLYGMEPAAVWRLKYRPPSDVYASDYERVAKALWAEAGRDFGHLTFLPDPEEMLEVADVMSVRSIYDPAVAPSKDYRENTRAHMLRFERMMEITKTLQGENLLAEATPQKDD